MNRNIFRSRKGQNNVEGFLSRQIERYTKKMENGKQREIGNQMAQYNEPKDYPEPDEYLEYLNSRDKNIRLTCFFLSVAAFVCSLLVYKAFVWLIN